MAYQSSFFNATQLLLAFSRNRDHKLIQFFFGVVGVPAQMPVDAVQLKTDLGQFCIRELRRGPLRKEDVRKICQIVRMQEQRLGPLSHYDAQTDTEWEWDGNALALVVVCELACQAAIQLEDQVLFSESISLQWGALKCLAAIDAPELEHVRELARSHAQAIEQRFDVEAILETFDKGMPKVEFR
jgi:hypothetical protein